VRSISGFGSNGFRATRNMSTFASAMASTPSEVLKNSAFPEEWPFKPEQFQRDDSRSDSIFYSEPRFVYHIDNFAISALTKYYESLPAPGDALDFCSSHVSHYPSKWTTHSLKEGGRIVVMGMNALELEKNAIASEYKVQDLNENPVFPFAENSFDTVTCCVSVDYLTRPREVFAEVGRILRPGGRAIFSFSNRCFPTKAMRLWLQTGDLDHVWIVGAFFHYTRDEMGANLFEAPEGVDISPPSLGLTDPMYVVTALKKNY
jgi:Methyltransferase domain